MIAAAVNCLVKRSKAEVGFGSDRVHRTEIGSAVALAEYGLPSLMTSTAQPGSFDLKSSRTAHRFVPWTLGRTRPYELGARRRSMNLRRSECLTIKFW